MKVLELSYEPWDFHLFSLRALNCLDINEDGLFVAPTT